jgi:hypothetical protein
VDVIAVIGAGEAARIRGSVGVPAVDQLGRAQPALRGGELAHQLRARARPIAVADLAVDRADVHRAARLVVRAGSMVGA